MKIKDVEFENNVFLAPMAGIADRAFRELCINYGAGYTVSEMVSSKGLTMGDKKSGELLTLGEIENPAGVQIFGDNPEIMAQAAKMCIKYHPNIIDINMGCPAPKIAMNGGGASLMKNPLLAGEIIKAVSKAVDIPVTVKIRKGWDDENITAVELAKIAEKNGAAAITVHGRTRMQMYSGKVDYDIIAGKFIIAGHKDSETISLSRKQIKKYKEVFRLDKHQKYMSYLFHNSRDEEFLKDVDKYGLLKTINKHIK